MKVLVVDDYDIVRHAFGRALQRKGVTTILASGVVAGLRATLECVADDPFDLIITDLDMNDGTGFDLVHTIRAFYQADASMARMPKVFFMTGIFTPEVEEWATALDGVIYDKSDVLMIVKAVTAMMKGAAWRDQKI